MAGNISLDRLLKRPWWTEEAISRFLKPKPTTIWFSLKKIEEMEAQPEWANWVDQSQRGIERERDEITRRAISNYRSIRKDIAPRRPASE